jgi:hypothetical protein
MSFQSIELKIELKSNYTKQTWNDGDSNHKSPSNLIIPVISEDEPHQIGNNHPHTCHYLI